MMSGVSVTRNQIAAILRSRDQVEVFIKEGDKSVSQETEQNTLDELRQRFFELILSNSHQNEIVWWGQNRIRYLEAIAKDLKTKVQQLTDQLSSNPESDEPMVRYFREN